MVSFYAGLEMTELAIVVPTYNEAENLALLVQELEQLGLDLHVFVVDDNSPDGTQQVARELSGNFGNVTLISRPGKLGLGSALRAGLKEALATDPPYLMTMDADCSHDPRDVPRLLDEIRAGDADLVQGSRYIDGGGVRGMSLIRRASSRMANLFYHWCAGAPHESTTNFRVFSRRAASVVAERAKGRQSEFVPEAVLLVLAAGMGVAEVPILFTNRARGSSKAGPIQVLNGITSLFSTSLQYRLRLGRFSRLPTADNPSAK